MVENTLNASIYQCKNYKDILRLYVKVTQKGESIEQLLEETILPTVSKINKTEEWLAAEIIGYYFTSGATIKESEILKMLNSKMNSFNILNQLYPDIGTSPITNNDVMYYYLGSLDLQKVIENKIILNVKDYLQNLINFKKFKFSLGTTVDIISLSSEFKNLIQLARNFENDKISAYYLKRAFLIAQNHIKSEINYKKLQRSLSDVIYNRNYSSSNKIRNVYMRDIGGYSSLKESVKKEILNVFKSMSNNELMRNLSIRPPRGILFYGEPGTGKSMFMDAIINEARQILGDDNVVAIKYNLADDLNKYYGASEKKLTSRFNNFKTMAEMNPNKFFFISMDEGDTTLGKRNDDSHESTKRLINKLLDYMDGQNRLPDNVIFLSATNKKDLYDEAALRPGRFDRYFYIGPIQSLEDAKEILGLKLKGISLEDCFDVKAAAEKIYSTVENCVGADIAEIVRMAKIEELDKVLKTKKTPKLSIQSLFTSVDIFASERSRTKNAFKKEDKKVFSEVV